MFFAVVQISRSQHKQTVSILEKNKEKNYNNKQIFSTLWEIE